MEKKKEKAEWVVFYLEKASDRQFKWEVKIETLDDLLKFIKKNWDIIMTADLWYVKNETEGKYKYWIKIYDYYVE